MVFVENSYMRMLPAWQTLPCHTWVTKIQFSYWSFGSSLLFASYFEWKSFTSFPMMKKKANIIGYLLKVEIFSSTALPSEKTSFCSLSNLTRCSLFQMKCYLPQRRAKEEKKNINSRKKFRGLTATGALSFYFSWQKKEKFIFIALPSDTFVLRPCFLFLSLSFCFSGFPSLSMFSVCCSVYCLFAIQ